MTAFGHRIRSVVADAATQTLKLVWDDGSTSFKAMAPLIARRRAFQPLTDADRFPAVHVINDGRAIAWNDDIDICADALWQEAVESRNDAA